MCSKLQAGQDPRQQEQVTLLVLICPMIVLSDGTRRFALPTLRARAVALPRAN
jgi:hypothetical protein